MHTAIIVEPRKHRALSFVLNNVLINLSDDWNVIVCHGTVNKEFVDDILNTDLKNYKSRVSLIDLGVENLTRAEYNELIASKKFYDFVPTEMLLVFQTDSMIFAKNKHFIDEFMEFDYVGAPWCGDIKPPNATVGNGGFSLRRKSKMLEIIEKVPYPGDNEDLYFSNAANHALIDFKKPSFDHAKRFSIEHVFSEASFGCHQPWNHYGFLSQMYPEIQILRFLQ
jgi:hypothetical protein